MADQAAAAHSRFDDLINKPDAFAILSNTALDGQNISFYMCEFMRDFCEVQTQYAENLKRLCKSSNALFQAPMLLRFLGTHSLQEIGALGEAWQMMLKTLLAVAQRHQQIAHDVKGEIITPMVHFQSQLEGTYKQYISQGKGLVEELEFAKSECAKAKEKYVKMCEKAQKAEVKLNDGSVAMEKRKAVEDQVMALKSEAVNLSTKYKQSIDAVRTSHSKVYHKEMHSVFKHLQSAQEYRADVIKENLLKFGAILHTTIPTTREWCEKMSDAAQLIDSHQIIDSIVLKHKSNVPNRPPRVPRFKPFGEEGEEEEDDAIVAFSPLHPGEQTITVPAAVAAVAAAPIDSSWVPETRTAPSQQSTSAAAAFVAQPTAIDGAQEPQQQTQLQHEPQVYGSVHLLPEAERQAHLTQIMDLIANSNYYAMLEVYPNASFEELAAKRDELVQRYGPGDYTQRIDQIYACVFANQQTREIYDRLAMYRAEYGNLLNAPDEQLAYATTNLGIMLQSIVASQMPHELSVEIEHVLALIQQDRNVVPQLL